MAEGSSVLQRRVLQHPIWRGADENDVRALLRRSTLIDCPAGAMVVRAGEPAKHIHLLLDGAVRVFYPPTKARGALTVKLFGAPASFGDAECVLQTTWNENVQALVRSQILVTPVERYFELLRNDAQLSFRQYLEVARQFGVAIQYEQAAGSAMARIIATIAAYASQFGRPVDGGVLVDYTLTQDILARESDCRRRSIVRALADLYSAKLMWRVKRRYCVASVEALLEHAGAHVPNLAVSASDEPWVARAG
ncbi:MAG TPA: Crp/Fnr family transcriptional regulator [Myxococcota bacterium]|nr:Crp/Fnr family transcriptional regulator [Myxococcota bacterium]